MCIHLCFQTNVLLALNSINIRTQTSAVRTGSVLTARRMASVVPRVRVSIRPRDVYPVTRAKICVQQTTGYQVNY